MVFAFGGITIIGAMLAGWSSSNKFSMLGALRAGSQMISYELIMGLTVLGLIVIYGTVDLRASRSSSPASLFGVLPAWGMFYQPFAAVLFLTAAVAENKRIPFDLPEAESELIAGYFTEYSAMKMGLFMFAEFIEIAIVGGAVHHALSRRLQPAVHDAMPASRCRAARDAAEPRAGRRDAAGRVPGQGAARCAASRSSSAGRCRASATTSCCKFAWKFMFPLALANLAVTVVAVWALRAG